MSTTSKKVQISQDAFDGLVKENMDDFGMDLQEALEDAIKTFQLQGADLRGIITDGSGSDNVASHPIIEAIKEVEHASKALAEKTSNESITKSLERLYGLCKEGGSETVSVAGRYGGVEASISAFKALGSKGSARNLVMKILNVLVGDSENREKFRQGGGPEMLMGVLTDEDEDHEIKMHACTIISTCATGDELAMEHFMDLNVAEELPKLLRENASVESMVLAICKAFRSLVTADDGRVVASKAFMNARTFAENGMVEAFLSTSSQLKSSLSAVASICMALKSLAVNEAICQSIAEQQGIDFVLQALDESAKLESKPLAKSACSLLSQLAGSDDNKDTIIYKGGLEKIINIMSAYSDDPPVLQETFAVITVISLRSPLNACKAVQAGALDMVAEAMESHPSAGIMQRQACLMLRNLAVRSPENRSAILEKGLKPLISLAKANHACCKDAASGALRDLGFDDYNS